MAAPQNNCALIFQTRRARILSGSKPWLWVGGIGALGFATSTLLMPFEFFDPVLVMFAALVSFTIMLPPVLVITSLIRTHYRCPRCNAIPMSGSFQAGAGGIGYSRGLMLHPKKCPSCGAPFV